MKPRFPEMRWVAQAEMILDMYCNQGSDNPLCGNVDIVIRVGG